MIVKILDGTIIHLFESVRDKNRAFCMGCSKKHPHYKFKKNQTAYTLWCERCGTRMHASKSVIDDLFNK